ncbi:Tetratricopeptide repeat-containing protein [Hymenobacter daecheongensis DSM 21074]|uniref:Tetratricopeptide repeat-containing protein n=2 Tax=Hymenobacter daecheongensis TaxID=496053 RepID=A0A1M6HL03_9BACT|nr:Tetratricopeptide repeat-containing protein [Hymenobacter daecheongensis DSM 21074]
MKKIFLTLVAAAALQTASAQTSAVTSAILNQRNGLLDKARADIDGAVLNAKTSAKAKTWYTRGEIYEQMISNPIFGKALKPGEGTKAAFESYSKAVELDGKDGEFGKLAAQKLDNLYGLALNAGVESYNGKNYDEALNSYRMAQQIRPQDTTAYLYAAYAAEAKQDFTSAKDTYSKLLGMNYKSPALYGRLLQIARQEKNDADAMKVVQQALVAYPNNKSFMIEEANMYLSSGRTVEAIGKLEKAIAVDPSNSNLYTVLGSIYQAKQPDKALVAFKKAIEVDPNNFDAQYNIGVITYNKGADLFKKTNNMSDAAYKKANGDKMKAEGRVYIQSALPYLEKAVNIQQNDKGALFALQAAYTALGRNADAERINAKMNAPK